MTAGCGAASLGLAHGRRAGPARALARAATWITEQPADEADTVSSTPTSRHHVGKSSLLLAVNVIIIVNDLTTEGDLSEGGAALKWYNKRATRTHRVLRHVCTFLSLERRDQAQGHAQAPYTILPRALNTRRVSCLP